MSWSPAVVAVLIALALALHTEGTEAKRGCSSFGHSCYGGMGKRGEVVGNEEPLADGQELESPEIVFTGPRSEYKVHHDRLTTLYNLSPFFRQWVRLARTMNAEPRHLDNM